MCKKCDKLDLMTNWSLNFATYCQIGPQKIQLIVKLVFEYYNLMTKWSDKFNDRINLLYFLHIQEINLYFSSSRNQFVTSSHFQGRIWLFIYYLSQGHFCVQACLHFLLIMLRTMKHHTCTSKMVAVLEFNMNHFRYFQPTSFSYLLKICTLQLHYNQINYSILLCLQ